MAPQEVAPESVDAFLESYSVPDMYCSRTTIAILGGLFIVAVLVFSIRAVMACVLDDSDMEECMSLMLPLTR